MRIFRKKTNTVETLRRRTTYGRTATVFSYHANRLAPQANTGRHQPEKTKTWKRYINRNALGTLPVWLSVIAIIIAVMYASTLSTKPRISVTANSGTLRRDTQAYSHDIARLLQGSTFNRSKVTISTTTLESQIKQAFPEVKEVQVTIPLLARQPVVRITASKPVCLLIDSKGNQFYVREDGVAMLSPNDIPNAPGSTTQVQDQSGLEVRAGQQIISKDTASFISQLQWQLNAQHINIAQLVLPATPHELQLRVVGEPYYVRFNTSRDARLQAGTYLALRESLRAQSKSVKEYIDVRVEERAYYK